MMSTKDSPTRAIVSYAPLETDGWTMKQVCLRPLKEKELLIEMVATGVCQTDLHFGKGDTSLGVEHARVMGHEGAGYVREIGPSVQVAKPGDPVLLSFASCSVCEPCQTHHPAHCAAFQQINFQVDPDDLVFSLYQDTPAKVRPDICGMFFGQSSFASISIVNEQSVVNVKGLVESKEQLTLLAPLGCGIQTGAGAILEAGKASETDRVVILGLGGVGLSAVMTAGIKRCKMIIGVDRVDSRLALAKELGATHVLNTDAMGSLSALTVEVRKLTHGLGATIILDTTGVPAIIQEAIAQLGFRGRFLQAGVAPPMESLQIPILDFVMSGKHFVGVVEGDVNPREYIPQLIQWVKNGNMPLEKIVRFYPAESFREAIHDMRAGVTIKPILLW